MDSVTKSVTDKKIKDKDPIYAREFFRSELAIDDEKIKQLSSLTLLKYFLLCLDMKAFESSAGGFPKVVVTKQETLEFIVPNDSFFEGVSGGINHAWFTNMLPLGFLKDIKSSCLIETSQEIVISVPNLKR